MQRKSVLPVAVGRADDYDGAKDRRGSKLNTIFKIGIPLAVVATVGVVFWLQQSSTDVKVAPTQTVAFSGRFLCRRR
jgi:flagellar basal body-associated protein FliL